MTVTVPANPHEGMLMLLHAQREPAVIIDGASFLVAWNARAEEVLGWTAQEIVGRSLVTTVIPPDFRAAHEHGLRKFLDTGEGPVLGQKLKLSAMHKDGREIPIHLSIAHPVTLDGRTWILAALRDRFTEAFQDSLAEIRQTVSGMAGGWLQGGGAKLLHALCHHLNWDCAVTWSPGPEGFLRCAAFNGGDARGVPELRDACIKLGPRIGADLPGRCWAAGETIWTENLLEVEDSRKLALASARMETGVVLPVLRGGECVAVIELFSRSSRSEDEDYVIRLESFFRQMEDAA